MLTKNEDVDGIYVELHQNDPNTVVVIVHSEDRSYNACVCQIQQLRDGSVFMRTWSDLKMPFYTVKFKPCYTCGNPEIRILHGMSMDRFAKCTKCGRYLKAYDNFESNKHLIIRWNNLR